MLASSYTLQPTGCFDCTKEYGHFQLLALESGAQLLMELDW